MAKKANKNGTVATKTETAVATLALPEVDRLWALPESRELVPGVKAAINAAFVRFSTAVPAKTTVDKDGKSHTSKAVPARPIGVLRRKEFGEAVKALTKVELKGANLRRAHNRLCLEFSRHAGPAIAALLQAAGENLQVNKFDGHTDRSGNTRLNMAAVILTNGWDVEAPKDGARKAVQLRQDLEKTTAENAALKAHLAELEAKVAALAAKA